MCDRAQESALNIHLGKSYNVIQYNTGHWISYYSCCQGKMHKQSDLKKEGLIPAHSPLWQGRAGDDKSMRQLVTLHLQSGQTEKNTHTGIIGQGMEPLTFRVILLCWPFSKCLHRQTQMCVFIGKSLIPVVNHGLWLSWHMSSDFW